MKALEPYVAKAIREGKAIHSRPPRGRATCLSNVSTDDLLKMKRGQGVYLELLFRKGVRDEFRQEALAGPGEAGQQGPVGGAGRGDPQSGRAAERVRTRASSSTWCGC